MSAARPGVLVAGLLAAALIAAVVLGLGSGGGEQSIVRAEFTSASGLLEGNEVRVQGAPAGSVERIELTDRDTALVTLRLKDGVERPRADATAAVKPVDLLGDVYLSLSPGSARRELRGTIGTQSTSNASRLTDLLAVFRPSVRKGLEAVFVELGLGLEQRGVDVNRATVRLRPALEATDELMTELGSQRADLRRLIEDAQRTTGQLAARDRELGGLVDGMATTLATTAQHRDALDRGLERAPGLLVRLGRTSRRLSTTARAATPLARNLRTAAPELARTTRILEPFLRETERAIGPTRPLVRSLHRLLTEGRTTFDGLATGVQALGKTAPDLRSLVSALVPAAAPISDGFFVNFTDEAAEPGDQPFDPFADPARRYWRGAAVFSCEAFGVKIAPNCLDQFLAAPEPADAKRDSRPESKPALPLSGGGAPRLPSVPKLPALPPRAKSKLDKLLPQPDAVERSKEQTRDLLDYLLGP